MKYFRIVSTDKKSSSLLKHSLLKSIFIGLLLCSFCLVSLHWTATAAQCEDVLFFASDVHGDTSTLSSLLGSCGGGYELVGLVGDHGSDTTQEIFDYIIDMINAIDAIPILTQGNHDGGYYTHPTGPVTDLSDNDHYDVYVINWDDFAQANSDLDNFLYYYTEDKVIIVLSHAPLHSKRNNIDQTAAVQIFDTLQEYGASLDIVFLWGHNHSRPEYDDNVDYVALPGETIAIDPISENDRYLIASVANSELRFTCLNAGYVQAASSATVLTIDTDEILIQRYGKHAQTEIVDR